MSRDLEVLWRRIAECEDTYDPEALRDAHRDAHAALETAVNMALQSGGLRLLESVMRDVDLRGW